MAFERIKQFFDTKPPRSQKTKIVPAGPDTPVTPQYPDMPANSITEQPDMPTVPTDPAMFPLRESTAWAGTSIYGAVLNWPKYNPDQLLSRQGPQIYDQMARDEQVKAVTKFKRDAILSRQWSFQYEEGSDVPPDQQQSRIAVLTQLFNGVKGGWTDSMAQILRAHRYGYSLTEKIFDLVVLDGQAWYGPIELRTKPPFTFYFKTDVFGDLVEFGQNFGGILQPLDIRKFIHYVNEPDEDLWFGRSELYAAYRSWYSKDVLIKMQNLYAERMAGGFLWVTREPSAQEPNRQDVTALISAIQNVKTLSGILAPPGYKAEMIHPPAGDMFSDMINYHDKGIGKALLVPDMFGISHQGRSGGGYSQSQTQLETFFWTIAADTARLEDAINTQLVEETCAVNWGDGQYPQFKYSGVSEDFVKWVVGQWVALTGANTVITTEADEAHLRRVLNMPQRTDQDTPLVTPAQEQAQKNTEAMQKQTQALPGANPKQNQGIDPGGAENMIRKMFTSDEWTANRHTIAASLHDQASKDATARNDTEGAKLHADAALAHSQAAEGMYNGAANMQELSIAAVKAGDIAGEFSPEWKPGDPNRRTGMQGYRRKYRSKIVAHTKDGKPRTCSVEAFNRAASRVAFSVIEQKTQKMSVTAANGMAPLIAKAVWRVVKDAKAFIAEPATIQDAKFSATDIGKLNKACQSTLQQGWLFGQQQAGKELMRAKAPNFSRLKFDAIRGDEAAQFLEANAFRMAGNLTDGARAIIQQELLNGVKSGDRPEDVAATIFERLIDKGFTDLDSVQDSVDSRDVNDSLSQAFGTDDDEGTLAYLNTLTRTNMFEAMNEARYEAFTDPALDGFVEGLEYSAILDDRTTEICQSLDGSQYDADSEVWDTYRPPNHYNCRSLLIPITKSDGWDGTESDPPSVEPADGFGAGSK